jgi:protein-tyrosine phosphatase
VFPDGGSRGAAYDLRTKAEHTAQPDRVPDGTEYIVVDVLADSTGAAPAQLEKALSDPKLAEELLGGGKSSRCSSGATARS